MSAKITRLAKPLFERTAELQDQGLDLFDPVLTWRREVGAHVKTALAFGDAGARGHNPHGATARAVSAGVDTLLVIGQLVAEAAACDTIEGAEGRPRGSPPPQRVAGERRRAGGDAVTPVDEIDAIADADQGGPSSPTGRTRWCLDTGPNAVESDADTSPENLARLVAMVPDELVERGRALSERMRPLVALLVPAAREFHQVLTGIYGTVPKDELDRLDDGGDLLNAVVAAMPLGYAEDCWAVIRDLAKNVYLGEHAVTEEAIEIADAYCREFEGAPVVVPPMAVELWDFVANAVVFAERHLGRDIIDKTRERVDSVWPESSPSASPLNKDGDGGEATAPEARS